MTRVVRAVGAGYPKVLIEGYIGPKGKPGPLPKGGSVIRKPEEKK